MARRQFLAQLAGLPFLSLGAKGRGAKKESVKNYDEECLGLR